MSEQDYYEVRLTNGSAFLLVLLLIILCALFFMIGRISAKPQKNDIVDSSVLEEELEPEVPDLSFYEIAQENEAEKKNKRQVIKKKKEALKQQSPPPVASSGIVKSTEKSETTKKAAPPEKTETVPQEKPGFSIQVGALSSSQSADKLKSKITDMGYPVFIIKEQSGGKTVYKVRVGKFSTESIARATSAKLVKLGFKTWIVKE